MWRRGKKNAGDFSSSEELDSELEDGDEEGPSLVTVDDGRGGVMQIPVRMRVIIMIMIGMLMIMMMLMAIMIMRMMMMMVMTAYP